jgi:hypothetical protein
MNSVSFGLGRLMSRAAGSDAAANAICFSAVSVAVVPPAAGISPPYAKFLWLPYGWQPASYAQWHENEEKLVYYKCVACPRSCKPKIRMPKCPRDTVQPAIQKRLELGQPLPRVVY